MLIGIDAYQILILILIVVAFIITFFVFRNIYDYARFYNSNTSIPFKVVKFNKNTNLDIQEFQDSYKLFSIVGDKDTEILVSINLLYENLDGTLIGLKSDSENHVFQISANSNTYTLSNTNTIFTL